MESAKTQNDLTNIMCNVFKTNLVLLLVIGQTNI